MGILRLSLGGQATARRNAQRAAIEAAVRRRQREDVERFLRQREDVEHFLRERRGGHPARRRHAVPDDG